MMPEGIDIARYVAEKCNPSLMPSDDKMKEKAFMLYNLQDEEDDGSGLYPRFKNYGCVNPLLNFFPREESEKRIPEYLSDVRAAVKYLAEELGDGPFFCGEAVTYADFGVFHYVDNIRTLDGGAAMDRLGDAGAKLRSWEQAMREIPAIAECLAERPQPGTGAVGKAGSIINTVAVPSELPVIKATLAALKSE
eukprot:TRINITY_DN41390_c0_g1_i2.p1 TRINITY_DN41390_c0_g1~~TRINITY_DN41390_c0_g1_i2.p1  ORF type:complete len:193 (+),score=46.73 TRINITY_DN41390_c0_g1_i2:301-879(+)